MVGGEVESSQHCNGNEISLGFTGAISAEMDICKPRVIGSAFSPPAVI